MTQWFPLATDAGFTMDPVEGLRYFLLFRSDDVCKNPVGSETRSVRGKLQIRFKCPPGTIRGTDFPPTDIHGGEQLFCLCIAPSRKLHFCPRFSMPSSMQLMRLPRKSVQTIVLLTAVLPDTLARATQLRKLEGPNYQHKFAAGRKSLCHYDVVISLQYGRNSANYNYLFGVELLQHFPQLRKLLRAARKAHSIVLPAGHMLCRPALAKPNSAIFSLVFQNFKLYWRCVAPRSVAPKMLFSKYFPGKGGRFVQTCCLKCQKANFSVVSCYHIAVWTDWEDYSSPNYTPFDDVESRATSHSCTRAIEIQAQTTSGVRLAEK